MESSSSISSVSSLPLERLELLRVQARDALTNDEHAEALDAIFDANGWTRDDFINSRHEMREMELFLLQFGPSIPQLKFFPFIVTLKLNHIGLTEIKYLESLVYLEVLWMSENDISRIEGLENCSSLRELYLHNNQIKRMENLHRLGNLEVLWLNRNLIPRIEQMEHLPKLRSLWIASNRIVSLQGAFSPTASSNLQELNVAANKISSFRDVPILNELKSLQTLYFSDPQYGENPMCQLSNYQTFTLFHLPHVRTLDYVRISNEQRQLAESTFVKKKIYYSMRIHTIQRNVNTLRHMVQSLASKKALEAETSLTVLERMARDLEQDVAEFAAYGTTTAADVAQRSQSAVESAGKALGRLKSAIDSRRRELRIVEQKRSEAMQCMHMNTEGHIQKMLLELNTGGNVRMEEGRSREVWFQSCGELVRTRFFAADFEAFGIKDVTVRKVMRVHNRGLRSRFDAALGSLVDLADPSYKRALEYLFFALPLDSDSDMLDALEHGFSVPSLEGLLSTAAAGRQGVPMTNSVFLAEQLRLARLKANGSLRYDGLDGSAEAFTGRLVVCKVFLGKCNPERTSSSAAAAAEASLVSSLPSIGRQEYPATTASVYRCRPQDPKQRVWFCFDAELVLPEYVVEYTYAPMSPIAPLPALAEFGSVTSIEETYQRFKTLLPHSTPVDLADYRCVGTHALSFIHWCDTSSISAIATKEAATALAEPIPTAARPPITSTATATTGATQGVCDDDTLSAYEALVLPSSSTSSRDCSLSVVYIQKMKIREVSLVKTTAMVRFASLKSLCFFDNELSTLPWVALAEAAPLLENLDVAHNQLKRLNELAPARFSVLKQLFVEHNLLYCLDDVKSVGASCPQLKHLSVSQNPCMLEKRATAFVCAVLPNLEMLSHAVVAEQRELVELSATPRQLDGPLLGFLVPAANALCNGTIGGDDNAPPADPTKAFRAFDDVLRSYSAHCLSHRGVPPLPTVHTSSQLPPVTVFGLNFTRLDSLSGIDRIRKLVHLRLRGNFIHDMEPLTALTLLESLDLEDNRIRTIDGLHSLTRLRRLDLSKNFIEKIEGLETLKNLQFFAFSHNRVTTLAPCQQLSALLELYCSNNQIGSEKEALFLRDLPKLIILDLAGNPCVAIESYRSYVVFQVKRLKVLDGTSIDANEIQASRDTFAGRISAELLKERLPPNMEWSAARELNLASCALKEITLLDSFSSLTHIKLEHNLLVSIEGLKACVSLVTLNLSHNKLGACCVGKVFEHLPNLESLSLEANGISSISALQLNCPRLKFLNLKSNEIMKVDGLDRVGQLREILLDRNRLRAIDRDAFLFVPYLKELYCEENCIKSIEGVHVAVQLQKVSFASNRLNEVSDIGKHMEGLPIVDICFLGNPVVRKAYYRNHLIHLLPNVMVIDNRIVTPEERERVESSYQQDVIPPNVFTDVRMPMGGGPMVVPVPPPQKVPLKVVSLEAEGGPGPMSGGGPNQRGRPPQTSGVGPRGSSNANSGSVRTNSADARAGAGPSGTVGMGGGGVGSAPQRAMGSGPLVAASPISIGRGPGISVSGQPTSFRKKP